MTPRRRRGERLAAATLVGMLALNYPLLDLFNRSTLVFGVPILFVYVFLAWGLLIGVIAAVLDGDGVRAARRSGSRPRSGC